MREMKFFDAAASVGLPASGGPGYADSRALLDEMDHYGVDSALIQHASVREVGSEFANRRIAAVLAEPANESKRLIGVASILPVSCEREQPDARTFFSWMKANGFAALSLYPSSHRYLPNRATLAPLLDEASERSVPVLVRICDFDNRWTGVVAFLEAFPKLRTILYDVGLWGADRLVRPVLETFPGAHFAVGDYWVPEGIASLVRKYGAERLLYSSGIPDFNHGSMMAAIRCAQIDENAKKQIAALNLERLVKEAEL